MEFISKVQSRAEKGVLKVKKETKKLSRRELKTGQGHEIKNGVIPIQPSHDAFLQSLFLYSFVRGLNCFHASSDIVLAEHFQAKLILVLGKCKIIYYLILVPNSVGKNGATFHFWTVLILLIGY